ncbi:MAG: GNAT family N-acetyltransferase [Pseudomonadota bacterium]
MKPEIYTQSSAFDILVNDWKELVKKTPFNEVFLTSQWQSTWWRHFGKNKELRLLAVRQEEGELLGLASFLIESSPDGKRVMKFLGGTDVTDYLDIIAKSGYEQEMCKKTVDFWKSIDEEWDLIDCHSLKDTAIALNGLKELAMEHGYSVEVSVEDVCPKINLPASWEDYLELLDTKDRHELRRKIRRVEKLPESVDRHSTEKADSLAREMGLFLSLHRKSNAEKEGFMNKGMESFFLAIANILFPENWLKLSFLRIGGIHVASSLCFDYQNKICLYNSGYDPTYSYLSPGIVLVAHLIREAIACGRSEFDFLRGREPYKYRFGARDSNIYRMVVKKGNS